MTDACPTVVVGGSGYVAGELIRLVLGHPNLELDAVVSSSEAGNPVAAAFPHLAPAVDAIRFADFDTALERLGERPRSALLSAAPHGATAELLDRALTHAEQTGSRLHVVDASADFRFASAERFAQVYGQEHGAPHRLKEFACGVPEHSVETLAENIGHPGCFATAMLLGIVPLLRHAVIDEQVYVSAVTGSTGSGRAAKPTTHHPQRHANLYAYKPLEHRHAPEVTWLAKAAAGVEPRLHFVPHSGPFARGIHATAQAGLAADLDEAGLLDLLRQSYAGSEFVRVIDQPPRLKDIVGSNFAHVYGTVDRDSVVVMVTLDNLLKGAAGGVVQWLNRLLGLAEHAGLSAPAAGWT